MKLLGLLRKYWFFSLLAPLFMIGEVSMDLMQPKLMSQIVDDGVLGNNMAVIISTGLKMLGFTALGVLSGVLSGVFTNLASQNFGNDLRKKVYDRVIHLSFEQTDKFTTGSLITRLTNDVTAVQDFVSQALRGFVRSGFMFAGGIIMLLSLDAGFGKITACVLPLQILVIFTFLKKVAPIFSKVQEKLDKVNSVMLENVTGARVIKAYVREEYEKDRFSLANDELMNTNLRVMKLMASISPLMMLLMNIAVVLIIYIGGFEVAAANMQVGEIMAAINYVTMIIHSLMMVSMMFQSITRARASMSRINEVLDTTPVISDGEGNSERESEYIIEFNNVSFTYPNYSGRPVIDNFNLKIRKGEWVAILGATGSGKTSLINLIPRFYDVCEGSVLVEGVDVREYKLNKLRNKICTVMQKSELYTGTVEENIRMGKQGASHDEVVKAAKIAQADDFINSFEDGYNTVISEKGSSLSGGQKQRVSIARALLKKPEVLIFDDSTSALDLATESRLHKALSEELSETTVIMIAQRVASVKNADRIVVIDAGEVKACGTHDELLKNSDIYIDIYNSQMQSMGEGASL